ncbi:hypothetical protein [Streptomyces sp. ISL-99]|nr:hypothetical protein [Streptomyces sp. ISL-99]
MHLHDEIRRHVHESGHAENSPAFWGYIRETDKWTDAASEDIGR